MKKEHKDMARELAKLHRPWMDNVQQGTVWLWTHPCIVQKPFDIATLVRAKQIAEQN